MYNYFNLIKDWRKKVQIPLFTILKIFFLLPVFRAYSFLQADQLLRDKLFKQFFNAKARKHKSVLSDSHMSNILFKLDSNKIREILYKIFGKSDKRLYTYNGLRIGVIDGTVLSKHYASVFHLFSKKAPFILDLEKYEKRGKELVASKKLIKRLTRKLGKNFVDLVLMDGLYRKDMIKFLKNQGINSLIKTSEERLAPIEELNLLINSKVGEDTVKRIRYLDRNRNEKYEIYSMEYEWNGEKIKVAKVTEEKLKVRKGEDANSKFYIITNQTELSMYEMRELAKMRWNIENNGFKELSSYAKTKHLYSKKVEVIESLMLIYFISYDLMKLFKYELELAGEAWPDGYGKVKKSFIHFVRMVGLLSEINKWENTS